MRIPYAMRAMIDEIAKSHEDAVLETRDPDGFGVWRTLVLDAETTKTYDVLLDELLDSRIASKSVNTDGQYIVRFVSDKRADDATPFYLDKALEVLNDDSGVRVDQIIHEPVSEPSEAELKERRAELAKIPVATLRSSYTLRDGTEFGPNDKKRDIVDAILTDEGF